MIFHRCGRQNLVVWAASLSKTIIIIKWEWILTLEQFSSEELYWILVTKFTNKALSNVCFEKIFPNMKFDWRKIYVLPRIITINTYLCSFQYKIFNKILFFNKKVFVFRMKKTKLFFFCNNKEDTQLKTIWLY